MPSLDAIQFDLHGSALREESDRHRMWSDSSGVYYRLQLLPQPPPWAFDLRDLDAATAFYAQQCRDNKGVMLSLKTVQIKGAVTGLQGCFKYRVPVPKSMAMYFVGILWLPFRDWMAQVNVEAMELGTTGAREATVMAMEGDKWPKPDPDAAPIVVNSMEEMFEHMRSRPLQVLPSDQENYDSMFAEHPLTKVRSRMKSVIDSLSIAVPASELKPFRLKSAWWKPW